MRYYLTTIFILTWSLTFSQKDSSDKKAQLGINLSSVFSREDKNGITPSVSVHFGQHFVSLGPRITFERLGGTNKKWKDDIALDLNYRFYPFQNLEKIRPFAQFSCEYLFQKSHFDRFYNADTNQFEPEFGLSGMFPNSFNLRTEYISHHLNLYLGLGTEITIWKNLFANVSGVLGQMFESTKFRHINLDTDNVEHELSEGLKAYRGSWLVSFGIGYRFK